MRAARPTLVAFVVAALLALAGCGTPSTPPPAVAVVHQAPVVTYDTFPPGRPPPHVSAFLDMELGLCATSFGLWSGIDVRYPRVGYGTVEGVVHSVTLTTQLNVRIWTMEGAGADVLPHEETHRAISEHYYRLAEPVARRLAAAIIGRKVSLPGRGTEAAIPVVLRPLQEEILAGYLREVEERCRFAQERFDTITDHGREAVANPTAMTQAIAEEEAHWRSRISN